MLGVIEEKGVACTRAVGRPDDLNNREGVHDVVDDGVLVHKLQRLLHCAAVGPQRQVSQVLLAR